MLKSNNIALELVTNIHTLEDSEVTALLKFLVRECDRRYIDHMEAIEEAEEELEAEAAASDDEDEGDLPEWFTDIAKGLDQFIASTLNDKADRAGW
jgi:hypothetical protein